TTRFREQLQRVGFSYDWSREVNTTDPDYFKWTQWIFLQLYQSYFDEETRAAAPIADLEKRRQASHPDESEDERRRFLDSRRLAYVSEVPVNWCPELGTVLANEEVIDGKSEVGGFPVERRPMRQWMLRITAYAERLIDELEALDWPEGIKVHQRNWIGRSEGAEVRFAVDGHGDEALTVFTTRPDTLFGATYMVVAPEHPLVETITTTSQKTEVDAYLKEVAGKSERDRADAKEKTGVFTGAEAINPVNGETIPIWIADYVLLSYGTGAIMAVPAHDERDHAFATTFDLEIIQVVEPSEAAEEGVCFSGQGTAVNSGQLDGLATAEAKEKIIAWLESEGLGSRTVNYKLRDWLFARQRYWGEPFPIVWREGHHYPLLESDLPVVAPEMDDYKPTGTTDPPLSKAVEWVRTEDGMRETNTMPQWAGSCWYFMRFCDAANADRFVGKEAEAYWLGGDQPGSVDLYIGGAEHAVLHLLYARFWHKVLFDLGYLSKREPFQRLVNQGIIMGPDNQKMSKSRGNVISPDDVIESYGADSLRLYEMFMGPLEQTKPWSDRGVEGVHRFLARVWRLYMELNQEGEWVFSQAIEECQPDKGQLRVLHETIKKVSEDTERLAFNTAIAQMMVFVNHFTGESPRPAGPLEDFLQLLNPYAPHLAEELHARMRSHLGKPEDGGLTQAPWPEWDEGCLVDDEVQIIVQVNGKLRDRIALPADADQEAAEAVARASDKVAPHLEGTIRKVIFIPGKILNFVVS
ncbi:MAG: leucine--tRNA ligase, partial [Verrucomicrobiota bacterium]